MDTTKLSSGVGGYSGPEVAKSNVVPIRPPKSESAAAVPKEAPEAGDRFTRSAPEAEAGDGVADRVTLTSVAEPGASDAGGRAARVAGVIAAVRAGTYRVDSGAAANALLSRMLGQGSDSGEAPSAE